MQILPTDSSYATAAANTASSALTITESTPFADLMQNITTMARKAANATPAAEQLAQRRAAAQNATGVQGTGQGAKVSLEEYSNIKTKLKELGLSDEELEELQGSVTSDEGMTWRALMQSVSNKLGISLNTQTPVIDSAMSNDLLSLFTKLGFNLQEGESLVNDLKQGKQVKILHILSKNVNGLSNSDLQAITRGELNTLAQALGLGTEAMQRLQSMLAGDQNGSMPSRGTRATLETIFSESVKGQKKLEDQLNQLRGIIESGLATSKEAKNMQALADNRDSKDVASARVMIQEEAKNSYRSGTQQHVSENQAGAIKNQELTERAGAIGGQQDGKDAKARPDQANTTNKNTLEAKAEGDAILGKNAKQEQNDAQFSGNGDKKAYQDMWNRVSVLQSKEASAADTMHQVEQAFGNQVEGDAAKLANSLSNAKVPPRQIAQSVQNGIMQNLSQGGKQLTLRLDPPSLGKLTVILQVTNNEVRATIKTNTNEATKLLHDQLHLIKHNLETQGLKVEKLDVQTQLNDNNNGSWQGAEQHNSLAQEHERKSLHATLRALRIKDGNGDSLAREMQDDVPEETLSHQGLHVIA